jgi:hypothetical protein
MSARTTGRALVITADGTRYFANVTIDGSIVHASEVRYRHGANGDYWYRPVEDRAWPMSGLREVRWLTDEVAA